MLREAVNWLTFRSYADIKVYASYGLIADIDRVKGISDLVSIEISFGVFENAEQARKENRLTTSQYFEYITNLLDTIGFLTKRRMIELMPDEADLTALSLESLEMLRNDCVRYYDEHVNVFPTEMRSEWLQAGGEYFILAMQAIEEVMDRKLDQLTSARPGGYVYLLRSVSGYWKIGRTINPQDRIKTFSVKLPFEVEYEHLIPCIDHVKAELELHERFAGKRKNGEWFCLDESDVAWIKAIKRL